MEGNYIEKVSIELADELGWLEKIQDPTWEYLPLLDLYTLLVFTKGEGCTLEDIHDAWSIWCNVEDPKHRSLKPFDELTLEVQLLDEKYCDAVRKVAAKLINHD
jgi:hypothetical protein